MCVQELGSFSLNLFFLKLLSDSVQWLGFSFFLSTFLLVFRVGMCEQWLGVSENYFFFES